ncbi:TetR/AcrR family transcriptional regulator [Neisseria sp. Ec49-e6-T10]|uniref:TetR/AcrR family transcriptional regulator n=1 Tax=Neisseria sp. Ec49-e6-T10 TaxID=3140744 RepID=UPI003EC0EC70
MSNTKEKILFVALRLFAQNGYEAVSISAIAGELGMTKGALYKHYKNKRDIFDSIFERVYQEDIVLAEKYGIPEGEFEEMPSAFKNVSLESLKNYIEAVFRIWLENELFRNFRKMLTLEQYRSPEMGDLYQKCVGQVSYIEDLFRGMLQRGVLKENDPKLLALEFLAPYHFLLNMMIVNESADIEEASNLLTAHIERFIELNATNKT